MKVWLAPSPSNKHVLLENGETAVQQSRQTRFSDFTYVLLQGSLIIVGSFLLFVGTHCLANQFFDNFDDSHKFFQQIMGFKRGETKQLQGMLLEEDRDVDDAEFDQFETLMKKHDITYTSQDELIHRYQIFSDNLKRIERAKKASKNTLFDVNRFTFMSDAELRTFTMPHHYYMEMVSMLAARTQHIKQPAAPSPKHPASVDWRTKGVVSRVKDQGKCSSSWAFAVTASIESMFAIRGHGLEERSEQDLIDCSANFGCNGGNPKISFDYIKANGQTLEKSYPYAQKRQSCRKNKDHKVKISGYKFFPYNESLVADYVASNGPVVVGVALTRNMFSYKGGVFNPSQNDCLKHHLGFHFLTIVGYGTEKGVDYWLLKNSWGPKAGDKGYIKMKRGVNSCGIGNWAMAPIL
uniref:Pept_C1 domain-containing protein n=1 Tax=Panagrellus redivivus TaxID=6233 RepID=A0A7E4V5T9_PANRE